MNRYDSWFAKHWFNSVLSFSLQPSATACLIHLYSDLGPLQTSAHCIHTLSLSASHAMLKCFHGRFVSVPRFRRRYLREPEEVELFRAQVIIEPKALTTVPLGFRITDDSLRTSPPHQQALPSPQPGSRTPPRCCKGFPESL